MNFIDHALQLFISKFNLHFMPFDILNCFVAEITTKFVMPTVCLQYIKIKIDRIFPYKFYNFKLSNPILSFLSI